MNEAVDVEARHEWTESSYVGLSSTLDLPASLSDSALEEFEHLVRLNDVDVTSRTDAYVDGDVVLTSELDRDAVSEWWTSHVERDELTTLEVEAYAEVDAGDAGVTAVRHHAERPVETAVLDGVTTSEPQEKRALGRTVATFERVDASWTTDSGDSVVVVDVDVHNPNPFGIRMTRLEHKMKLNDVVVSRGETDGGLKLPRRRTTKVRLTPRLRSRAMADWWPTHVLAGERTEFDVEFTAVLSFLGFESRHPAYRLRSTVETSALQSDGGQA
ncbi:MAG: LEA type 2 family protein [Halobacteriota archaeon]